MDWQERFMQYVEKKGGCWVWTGATFRNGRPAFWYNGKTRIAYRFHYRMVVGKVGKKFDLHHKCLNEKCVNPKHLLKEDHVEHIRKYHGKKVATA